MTLEPVLGSTAGQRSPGIHHWNSVQGEGSEGSKGGEAQDHETRGTFFMRFAIDRKEYADVYPVFHIIGFLSSVRVDDAALKSFASRLVTARIQIK